MPDLIEEKPIQTVPRVKDQPEDVNTPAFDERGELWGARIENANEYYTRWAELYKTKELEEYYYGHQWGSFEDEDFDQRPYVHNEFFVAIDIKQPTLLFRRPQFKIKPRMGRQDWNPEDSFRRAKIRENTLNTLVATNSNFGKEVELAILDAFFRFGIIEVGYAADWIQNPDAGKPVVASDVSGEADEGDILREPARIPQNERLYVKRVPAKTFRVGGLDSPNLNRCSWCGYYEWVRTADLLSNPMFRISEDSLAQASASTDDAYDGWFTGGILDNLSTEGEDRNRDIVKIWHIWDMRDKRKLIIPDSSNEIIYERKFDRLPIIPLIFRPRLQGFYPLPLTFNWLSAQDEINENREAARTHRRAFKRRVIIREDAFTEQEVDKLLSGGDGTVVSAQTSDVRSVIAPVPNADLGAQHVQAIRLENNDFDNIAGITAEQRGHPGQEGRTTATQARLVDERSAVRETRDQSIVAEWFCRIGKEMLKQAKEKISGDLWVEWNMDSISDNGLLEERSLQDAWRLINTEEFGNSDFDVDITVQSQSPLGNMQRKQAMMEFFALINQYPQAAMDPLVVRDMAFNVGFDNEQVVAKLQRLATMLGIYQQVQLELGLQQIAQQSGGLGGDANNNLAQRTASQATPNTQEQINQQVQNQSF